MRVEGSLVEVKVRILRVGTFVYSFRTLAGVCLCTCSVG